MEKFVKSKHSCVVNNGRTGFVDIHKSENKKKKYRYCFEKFDSQYRYVSRGHFQSDFDVFFSQLSEGKQRIFKL